MNIAKLVLRAIIGLAFASASLYLGYFALHQSPIDVRLIYVAAGGLVLSGLIIDTDPIFTALKNLLSLLPSVKFGGQP